MSRSPAGSEAAVGGTGQAESIRARDGGGDGGARADPAVAVRLAAVRTIARLLDGGGSLTRLVPEAQAALPPGERALLRALAYGLARWADELAALVDALLERPLKARDRDVELLLRLGLFQLRHTRAAPHAVVDASVRTARALGKPWARGLVNAVLRNYQRRGEALAAGLDEAARLSHPRWLLERLRADWPERWREIGEANNRRGPMTLRVNVSRTDREGARATLAEAGLEAVPLADVPTALTLGRPVDVAALPGFEDGALSVQDGAAQLAVATLLEAPLPADARLLDACAAPGGKSAQALESGRVGELVALDRDAARLERVRETLARIGLGERATLRAADAAALDAWWDGEPFDAVLIDAPCSGTGVIRRHPDIKLLRRESDVAALVAEQTRLLDALWPTLRPGGALLYASCSVLRAEGEERIVDFLARHPDATFARERRVLTGEGEAGGMDGFYIALLSRTGNACGTPPTAAPAEEGVR